MHLQAAVNCQVCSSTHMVHFVTSFTRIAEKHGFTLIRMPIAQLFPPPAPYWVFCNFDNDRETDFDRLAFYPRQQDLAVAICILRRMTFNLPTSPLSKRSRHSLMLHRSFLHIQTWSLAEDFRKVSYSNRTSLWTNHLFSRELHSIL